MTAHFTDEKTEAQRGHVPCGKPHNYKVAEPQIRERRSVCDLAKDKKSRWLGK